MTASFDPHAQKPEVGCILHLTGTIEVFGMKDDHQTWEILKVTQEQKGGDPAPRTYLQLKSIDHWEGLRFVTAPYDPATMRIFPPPDKTVTPKAAFPQPGSQVRIEESEAEGFAAHRSGLWQVDKSGYVPREDGSGEDLKLQLSSINRKHQAFMNVIFNEKCMKPVPIKASVEELSNMQTQRHVALIKPISIKKRNAAP